jgi:hypothetical protein
MLLTLITPLASLQAQARTVGPAVGFSPQKVSAARAQATIHVAANAGWTNTNLDVKAGKPLSIKASGTWTDGSSTVGPSGSTRAWPDNFFNLTDLGVCSVCARTDADHWDALIGYIGNSPPAPGSYTSKAALPEAKKIFLVGGNFNANAPRTGRLWLAMNADAYSGYTVDNSGQVTAIIKQSSTPAKPLSIPQTAYAGYSASPKQGTTTFVVADWKVPALPLTSCFKHFAGVAAWIGLWGPVAGTAQNPKGSPDDSWLPQVGTISNCNASLRIPSYLAVVQIFNAKHNATGFTRLFLVFPGDSMSAQIEYAGPGTGTHQGKLSFWYSISDNTTGGSRTGYLYTTINGVKLANAAFQGGAIVEREADGGLSGELPDFSWATFTNVGVGQDSRDGPRNGLWTTYRWDMMHGKKPYAKTGPIQPATFPIPEGTGKFTVNWANYQ